MQDLKYKIIENKSKIITIFIAIVILTGVFIAALSYKNSVTVMADDKEMKIHYIGNMTALKALSKTKIALGIHDSVNVNMTKTLKPNSKVIVTRSKQIILHANTKKLSFETAMYSIDDIVNQSGIELKKNEKVVQVSKTSDVYVKIKQNQKVFSKEKPVEFKTKYVTDPKVRIDTQKVVNKGKSGKVATIEVYTYDKKKNVINIRTIFRDEISKPKDKIIHINPKNTVNTASGNILKVSDIMNVSATGYCPCKICVGNYNGQTTADGSQTVPYYTVAAPPSFSFGTMLYIPYFESSNIDGIFEVQDRGGAIQGNKIDIFFSSHREALNFGRRTIEIYILK